MGEDQALQRLRDILARPEYQVDRSQSWWEPMLRPILNLLGDLLIHLIRTIVDASTGREGWFGLAVLGVCAVLIAAVLVYLVRAIRLSVRRESRSTSANLAERRQRSERMWQMAQQLAAEGRLAEAARLAYLSALYALDERALLHVESGLTNREHATRLSRMHPDVAQTFSELVERYDRVRYRGTPLTHASFADLSAWVARARAAALSGAAR
jgi:hypothetical protein